MNYLLCSLMQSREGIEKVDAISQPKRKRTGVILFISILAIFSFSQYTKIIEKERGVEARMALEAARKLALEHYFKNGSLLGITSSDVGIGSYLPFSCTSTSYFYHRLGGGVTAGACDLIACRCTKEGKAPQSAAPGALIYTVRLNGDTSRWDGQTATDGFTFWQASECNCSRCRPVY